MFRQRISAAFFVFLLNFLVCNVSGQETLVKSTNEAQHVLSERGEVILHFVRPHEIPLSYLTELVSIEKVANDTITAYADEVGFREFLRLNIPFEVLDPPSLGMKSTLKSLKSSQVQLHYPSYTEYLNMMEGFVQNYPGLCTLEEYGKSVKNRSLLALKISDNSNEDEDEPVVFYSASMHGDEAPGYVLLLHLIEYLLSNYNNNTEIKSLIDRVELWINPCSNPDGTYFNSENSPEGATRFNANHVDLNRDFPDVTNNSPARSYQQETEATMRFMERISPCLSANLHSGAEVVNYPWDSWSSLHPDDNWYKSVSRSFADTVHKYSISGYMDDLDNGITNGYAWYKVLGSRQDYSNFFLYSREVTIEISDDKYPPETVLGLYWDYNHRSLMQYIEYALTGISGQVMDSVSGDPLKSQITIMGHDIAGAHSYVFSLEKDGKFYRLLNEGNYSLRISAPGYMFKDVVAEVKKGEMTDISVRLSGLSRKTLHPNPFAGRLFIDIPFSGTKLSVTFSDGSGRIVKSISHSVSNPGIQEISADGLPDGFYIITITNEGQTHTMKGIHINR